MSSIRLGIVSSFFIALLIAGAFAFFVPLEISSQAELVISAAHAETKEERRARLEQELAAIEAEIEAQRGDLSVLQAERTTLERDVAILDTQIARAQLEIRQRDIVLQQIGGNIEETEQAIEDLDAQVERGLESLAQLIRLSREMDDRSLVEMVLAGSVSDFFADVDNYEAMKRSMSLSIEQIRLTQEELIERKLVLEERHEEESSLRQFQVLARQDIERQEQEKQRILAETRGEEERYQEIIAEREQNAAEIRAALFALADSTEITFGAAYEYAKNASALTGVRPEFVLGILQTESRLGQNVGQCLITNSPNKGDGKGVNTGRHFDLVMHPNRDVDPFMAITAELGIDPWSQVVSCPQSFGYGGAMGPAQFIPSTWMLFKDRIGRITGQNPPNPWDPATAFVASALYVSDLGADAATRESERQAACRYFSGRACGVRPHSNDYAAMVLGHADDFERQIDVLEGR